MSSTTSPARRRLATVPAVWLAALLLLFTAPLWVPLSAVLDAARGRLRCPTTRLLGFGTCWAWLETAGVFVSSAMWLGGQSRNQALHYRLQRWWSRNLVSALRATCGVRVELENIEALSRGPVVLLVRHASLADALVSAYVVTNIAALQPRFVLKRELLADPCLDIVGNRIPNYFVDRHAADSVPELEAIEQLAGGLGLNDAAIIFPEGTRANTSKRRAALERIGGRDPGRAARLAPLRHLLPPRPSGARAMMRGAPGVDVVLVWHVGFEGLDTFGGILRALSTPIAPIRFVARRVSRCAVPEGDCFESWLDQQWLRMDAEVDTALRARGGQ